MSPQLPPLNPQPQPLQGLQPQLGVPVAGSPEPVALTVLGTEAQARRSRQLERLRRADAEIASPLEEIRRRAQEQAEQARELEDMRARLKEQRYWLPGIVRWERWKRRLIGALVVSGLALGTVALYYILGTAP